MGAWVVINAAWYSHFARYQRWLGKFGQWDEWIAGLKAARMAAAQEA